MLTEARFVLSAADVAMTRVRAAVGRLHGRLRLGCSFDLQQILTPLLQTLRSRQPDLRVDVGLGTQEALLHDLRADRIDAALTWRKPADAEGVHSTQLLVAPLLAVVRADDPLARLAPPLSRAQLRSRPLIIHHRHAAPGPYDEMIEQFYRDTEPGPLRHVDVLASGHEARLRALHAGTGVALMADFAHRSLDTTGTTVLEVAPRFTISVELLWTRRALDSTRAVTSYLSAIMAEEAER